MSEFDWKRLREYSIKRWPEWMGTTHGIEHWDRVAKFGRLLYKEGADMDVIMAFAYLLLPKTKETFFLRSFFYRCIF